MTYNSHKKHPASQGRKFQRVTHAHKLCKEMTQVPVVEHFPHLPQVFFFAAQFVGTGCFFSWAAKTHFASILRRHPIDAKALNHERCKLVCLKLLCSFAFLASKPGAICLTTAMQSKHASDVGPLTSMKCSLWWPSWYWCINSVVFKSSSGLSLGK